MPKVSHQPPPRHWPR